MTGTEPKTIHQKITDDPHKCYYACSTASGDRISLKLSFPPSKNTKSPITTCKKIHQIYIRNFFFNS